MRKTKTKKARTTRPTTPSKPATFNGTDAKWAADSDWLKTIGFFVQDNSVPYRSVLDAFLDAIVEEIKRNTAETKSRLADFFSYDPFGVVEMAKAEFAAYKLSGDEVYLDMALHSLLIAEGALNEARARRSARDDAGQTVTEQQLTTTSAGTAKTIRIVAYGLDPCTALRGHTS